MGLDLFPRQIGLEAGLVDLFDDFGGDGIGVWFESEGLSGGSDACSDLQVFEQGPALEGAKGMVCCGGDGFAQGRFEFKRGLDTVVDDVRDRAGVDFPVVSESMN